MEPHGSAEVTSQIKSFVPVYMWMQLWYIYLMFWKTASLGRTMRLNFLVRAQAVLLRLFIIPFFLNALFSSWKQPNSFILDRILQLFRWLPLNFDRLANATRTLVMTSRVWLLRRVDECFSFQNVQIVHFIRNVPLK